MSNDVLFLRGIRHHNILASHLFTQFGRAWLVFSHAPEGTLFNYMETEDRLTEDEARRLIKQVFDAIDHLVSKTPPLMILHWKNCTPR